MNIIAKRNGKGMERVNTRTKCKACFSTILHNVREGIRESRNQAQALYKNHTIHSTLPSTLGSNISFLGFRRRNFSWDCCAIRWGVRGAWARNSRSWCWRCCAISQSLIQGLQSHRSITLLGWLLIDGSNSLLTFVAQPLLEHLRELGYNLQIQHRNWKMELSGTSRRPCAQCLRVM